MTDRDRDALPPASAEEEDGIANPPPAQRQEDVEDRPSVSTVKPEDYPEDQRAKGA